MNERKKFLKNLSEQKPLRSEQAVALLWYYEKTGTYTERSVADLIADIKSDGFGDQNKTRLTSALKKNINTVVGSVKNSFRINSAKSKSLNSKYSDLLSVNVPEPTSSVIPFDYVLGTRKYLEKITIQINGSYDLSFYDASAVMLRRLAESLLIEVYIHQGRETEIKNGGSFMMFNNLILYADGDNTLVKDRSFLAKLNIIKDIGDTAAHSRTYITLKKDIDDNIRDIQKIINELLVLSGIKN